MTEPEIEKLTGEALTGDARKNALEFISYLKANEMSFERGIGYWEDKLYWLIKYKGEYVCFILISGAEDPGNPWTIWSDDSDCNCFEKFPLDEHIKEFAWKSIDFCENCGNGCNPGKRKTIFGKAFDNVCRTAIPRPAKISPVFACLFAARVGSSGQRATRPASLPRLSERQKSIANTEKILAGRGI